MPRELVTVQIGQCGIQLGTRNVPYTLEEMEQTRMARFDLNLKNESTFKEGKMGYALIDQLMEQVPGKNGYSSFLYDPSFGENATFVNYDRAGLVALRGGI